MRKYVVNTLVFILCMTFVNCEDVATLFHGQKPEEILLPKMTVMQEAISIKNNEVFSYPKTGKGLAKSITFNIRNSGKADLIINSNEGKWVDLTDNNTGYFEISEQPSLNIIAPGEATTFIIRFEPIEVGENFSAVIQMSTNCRDNPDFSFTITGDAKDVYTVIYNSNGGSGVMENCYHLSGEFQNLRSNNFTYGGYVFLGWALRAGEPVEYFGEPVDYFDQQSVNLTAIIDNGTVTLYARWSIVSYYLSEAGSNIDRNIGQYDWIINAPFDTKGLKGIGYNYIRFRLVFDMRSVISLTSFRVHAYIKSKDNDDEYLHDSYNTSSSTNWLGVPVWSQHVLEGNIKIERFTFPIFIRFESANARIGTRNITITAIH